MTMRKYVNNIIIITCGLVFEWFIYTNVLRSEKNIGHNFCQQVSSILEWRGRHKSQTFTKNCVSL